MLTPLSPADAWQEMRLHMEWNERFSLCFLFADSHADLATMRQWVDDTWQCKTAPLLKLEPQDATSASLEVLQGIESHVQRLPMVHAPVWVQMLAQDGYQKNDWNQARATLLARLNESREWLINGFARPLIVCLPSDWQQRAPQIAPDLWHVRSFTALLKASAPAAVRGSEVIFANDYEKATTSQPHRTLADAIQSTIAPLQQAVAAARVRLQKSPETFNLQRELSIELCNLGDGFLEVSLPSKALIAYRESLEIFRQLRESLGDSPQVLRDLAASLQRIGNAESNAGRNDAALVAYRESLELARQLRESLGDSPQVLRDLSASLSFVGNAETAAGRNDAALIAYRESLELARQLRESLGDSPQVLRDLSASLSFVGNAEMEVHHYYAALIAYRESLELARQLRESLGDSPQVLRDLLVFLIKVGDAETEVHHYYAALVAYRESLELARQLRKLLGDSPQVLRDLTFSLDSVGNVKWYEGRNDAALVAYRESLELRRQLRTSLGDSPQVLRDLFVSLIKVGDGETAARRNDAALVAYRESLELARQLRESVGDSPRVLDDLAVSLEKLAASDGVDMPLRKDYINEALALRQQLVAVFPDSELYRKRLNNLATIQASIDRMESP